MSFRHVGSCSNRRELKAAPSAQCASAFTATVNQLWGITLERLPLTHQTSPRLLGFACSGSSYFLLEKDDVS